MYTEEQKEDRPRLFHKSMTPNELEHGTRKEESELR